jgi:hypothetical protein
MLLFIMLFGVAVIVLGVSIIVGWILLKVILALIG